MTHLRKCPVVRAAADVPPGQPPHYTIATLVTDFKHYQALQQSFRAGGFTTRDCEYIFVDNTGPLQTDAYAGLNALLDAAQAPIVILCHQDVRLIDDGRDVLDERLSALGERDPSWAVAGNAGGLAPGELALRISDPHGRDRRVGDFPQRVATLDENLLIVRRDARIGFSHDLAGFHFYGADICLHAAQMGLTAYVIDFHLQHLSPGRKGADFDAAQAAFRDKWCRALSPRWLQTTCSLVRISGSPIGHRLGRIIERPFARLARHRWSARGWTKSPLANTMTAHDDV